MILKEPIGCHQNVTFQSGRDGFWHASERPKESFPNSSKSTTYNSVGGNCVLLFNVPPNSTELKKAIDTTFSTDLAKKTSVSASSQRGGEDGDFGPEIVLDNNLWTYWAPDETGSRHWIELKAISGGMRFNVVKIQEPVGMGQRIVRHEVYADGKMIVEGTIVGYIDR